MIERRTCEPENRFGDDGGADAVPDVVVLLYSQLDPDLLFLFVFLLFFLIILM